MNITPERLKRINHASDRLESLFWLLPTEARSTPIVAGGFIRQSFDDVQAEDVDLFFEGSAQLDFFLGVLERRGWKEASSSTSTKTLFYSDLPLHLNLIRFAFVSDVRTAAERVDFHCCAFAARCLDGDFRNVELYLTEQAVSSCERKVLTPQNAQSPVRTAKRVMKYQDKGYTMHPDFDALWSAAPRVSDGY